MADEKPLDHQAIEHSFKPLQDAIEKLPDNIASREVKRLIPIITDLAHESLEQRR